MTDYLSGLLGAVAERVPTVARALRQGESRLDDYVNGLAAPGTAAYQPHTDVARVAAGYCARLLGESAAQRLEEELTRMPLALTANHHGVDFFAQSVQGSLALSLRSIDGQQARTVPVFACGSVAMNNLTYPRGVLAYQTDPARAPLRIPVFPDRVKRQLVARTEPYNAEMLGRTLKRVRRLQQDGLIAAPLAAALEQIMHCYGDETLLAAQSYSDQAVLLNHRLWQQMFPASAADQLIYLELEALAQALLIDDLADRSSLVSLLLFDEQVCTALAEALVGVKGCWQYAGSFKQVYDQGQAETNSGHGTFMFWGVDERQRRFGLRLDRQYGERCLRPLDSSIDWSLPLQPDSMIEALQSGKILPSLFTCYSAISLARGVVCAGGYYQAEYLPAMQAGVVAALAVSEAFGAVAEQVAQVRTDAYLSGMQAVMCPVADGLIPAGPAEMIAAGGLQSEALQRVAQTSVRHAHIGSLSETLADVFCNETKVCWQRLAEECYTLLGSRALVVRK